MANIAARSKCVPAIVPTAGAVDAITATEVNATGFDRALFIVTTGAAAAGATIDLKVQKAPATGMANPHDVLTFTQLTAAGSASKTFMADCPVDPAHPFMILVGEVKVDTFANGAVCLLYEGSRTYPASDASTETLIA